MFAESLYVETRSEKVAMYLPPLADGQEWIGIIIAIPEPWVTHLTELRRSLGDEQANRVPAHITLLPPTAVNTRDREALIHHLSTIAQRHQAFTVTLRGSDSFRPVSPVAFVKVDGGAQECTELAEDIRSGILDVDLRFPYHPHVTLAHGLDDASLDAALDATTDFEASWKVPGFRLDRVDASGHYSSMALFDFEVN